MLSASPHSAFAAPMLMKRCFCQGTLSVKIPVSVILSPLEGLLHWVTCQEISVTWLQTKTKPYSGSGAKNSEQVIQTPDRLVPLVCKDIVVCACHDYSVFSDLNRRYLHKRYHVLVRGLFQLLALLQISREVSGNSLFSKADFTSC